MSGDTKDLDMCDDESFLVKGLCKEAQELLLFLFCLFLSLSLYVCMPFSHELAVAQWRVRLSYIAICAI